MTRLGEAAVHKAADILLIINCRPGRSGGCRRPALDHHGDLGGDELIELGLGCLFAVIAPR
jgi:hypothetical protein